MPKLKILFGLLLIVAAVGYFFSDFMLMRDERALAAREFARKDSGLIREIGTVEKLTLRRHVSVQASNAEAAYSIYDFMASGEKGKASIAVRATPKRSGTIEYSVDP